MAWSYSDWIAQSGASDRLSRLRLHIQEVADAMQPGRVAEDGTTYDPQVLQSYLAGLQTEERSLRRAQASTSHVRGKPMGF